MYNIFSTAYDLDDLLALIGAMPGERISEALYSGSADFDIWLKLRVLYETYGHWGTLKNLYDAKQLADRLLEHYEDYPSSPDDFGSWRSRRDSIMDDIYAEVGAEPKY